MYRTRRILGFRSAFHEISCTCFVFWSSSLTYANEKYRRNRVAYNFCHHYRTMFCVKQISFPIIFNKVVGSNSQSQNCFYSNTEFRNQYIVSTIKFGESLSKIMIPIALLENLVVKLSLRALKSATSLDTLVNRISCNPVRGRTGNVTVQKWKIYYIKIKDIAFIINFRWNKSVWNRSMQIQKWGFDIRGISFV